MSRGLPGEHGAEHKGLSRKALSRSRRRTCCAFKLEGLAGTEVREVDAVV